MNVSALAALGKPPFSFFSLTFSFTKFIASYMYGMYGMTKNGHKHHNNDAKKGSGIDKRRGARDADVSRALRMFFLLFFLLFFSTNFFD